MTIVNRAELVAQLQVIARKILDDPETLDDTERQLVEAVVDARTSAFNISEAGAERDLKQIARALHGNQSAVERMIDSIYETHPLARSHRTARAAFTEPARDSALAPTTDAESDVGPNLFAGIDPDLNAWFGRPYGTHRHQYETLALFGGLGVDEVRARAEKGATQDLLADIAARYPGKNIQQIAEDAQEILQKHGYTGPIDAKFGPKSRAALSQYRGNWDDVLRNHAGEAASRLGLAPPPAGEAQLDAWVLQHLTQLDAAYGQMSADHLVQAGVVSIEALRAVRPDLAEPAGAIDEGDGSATVTNEGPGELAGELDEAAVDTGVENADLTDARRAHIETGDPSEFLQTIGDDAPSLVRHIFNFSRSERSDAREMSNLVLAWLQANPSRALSFAEAVEAYEGGPDLFTDVSDDVLAKLSTSMINTDAPAAARHLGFMPADAAARSIASEVLSSRNAEMARILLALEKENQDAYRRLVQQLDRRHPTEWRALTSAIDRERAQQG